MDTLTHALSGALLARATAGAKPAPAVMRRIAAGFFACAAPDLDFVASFGGPVASNAGATEGPARNLGVFALPVGQLIVVLVAGGLVGVLAAVRPARRAARMDVLAAVAAQ